ncbi:hypothetical protein QTG54_015382 [Skeletonema marinoi]|uniref:Uncharacterized protein n=1 Tax=Skeletonema marinoi TaxID=267567 RepID=A0AAD8XUX2_9STRA|nr:hypothetical protein QTG54_015382 [Skeletonema marinoi]
MSSSLFKRIKCIARIIELTRVNTANPTATEVSTPFPTYAPTPIEKISFDTENNYVTAFADIYVYAGSPLIVSLGDQTDPTPSLPSGRKGFLEPKKHKKLGYEFNQLLFQTDTGSGGQWVYPAVWGISFLKILQDSDASKGRKIDIDAQSGKEIGDWHSLLLS